MTRIGKDAKLARLLLAVGLACVATGAGSGAVGADTTPAVGNSNTFAITAEGDSIEIAISDPSLPLVPMLALSPYGASAKTDSVGDSLSDAGLPYSPLAFSLPGTVSGLGAGGLLPPIPPLPGYVSASYPTDAKNVQSQGPYLLDSTASQYAAQGQVQLGVVEPGSDNASFFAKATTTANTDGSVTATATAGADVLNVGGLIDLGNVSSTASMTEQASGSPTITSSSNLGTITLLSKTSGLTASGLYVLGVNIPLKLTTSLVPVLNEVLKPAGITLTYLPTSYTYTDGSTGTGTVDASKTVESVDSGALEVSISENVKTQGEVTTAYTVGRTFLSMTDTPGIGYTPPPSESSTGTLPTGSLTLGGGGVAPIAGGVVPSVSPAAPGTSSAPTPPSTPAQRPAALTVAPLKTNGAQGLFLVLVLGAIVVLGGSQLVRLLGVRLQLSSRSGPLL